MLLTFVCASGGSLLVDYHTLHHCHCNGVLARGNISDCTYCIDVFSA
jgi:hypothetical protein